MPIIDNIRIISPERKILSEEEKRREEEKREFSKDKEKFLALINLWFYIKTDAEFRLNPSRENLINVIEELANVTIRMPVLSDSLSEKLRSTDPQTLLEIANTRLKELNEIEKEIGSVS